MVDTRAMSQPLTTKARMGTRQRKGLKMKLRSKAEAFLIQMRAKTANGGSVANIPESSSRATISSERRLLTLAGETNPNAKPATNREIAIIIHFL